MSIQQAYDRWAASYDTNRNRTRDLEALVLREALAGQRFRRIGDTPLPSPTCPTTSA